MKKFLFGLLVVLMFNGVAFAQDAQPVPAAQPEPAQVAPALVSVEGQIVLEKTTDGKDVVKVKAGLVEMILEDVPVVQELLKIEKLAEKVFVLEGEKVLAADGVTETFKVASFKEAVKAPASDDHGHDHSGHDHGDHDGHGH